MPTARELLEQADALMRRNRGRESEPDIPELTDEVVLAEPVVAERGEAGGASAPGPSRSVEDVPELTDALGQVEEVSIEAVPEEVESRWLESMLGGASVTGPAPDSIAVVPPSTLRAAEPASEPDAGARGSSPTDEHVRSPEIGAAPALPPAEGVSAGAGDPAFDAMLGLRSIEREPDREFAPPATPPDSTGTVDAFAADEAGSGTDEEGQAPIAAQHEIAPAAPPPAEPAWDAVAEEIRMQVLQRIDIFTDTSLQGELAARLQPVVDRASADLIATINREVGQLLRAYVAEAIEREIEKWRESNP
jgi:hypothetical protein